MNTARNQLPNAGEAASRRTGLTSAAKSSLSSTIWYAARSTVAETTIDTLLAADRADDQGMMFGVAVTLKSR